MAETTVLILAGTTEAALLARRVAAEPEVRLIVSLAGATRAPAALPGTVRSGGFGGANGLAEFLRAERVTHLLDATHPFAAGMSRNAAAAARLAGVPRLALQRQAWVQQPGERWSEASCFKAAVDLLPMGARPFLALGLRHIAAFRHRADLRPVVRTAEPPFEPPFCEVVVGPPFADAEEEEALLTRLGVSHLVARNAGGSASYAKIEAARRLQLPVVMIRRPPPPPPPLVATVGAAFAWLSA